MKSLSLSLSVSPLTLPQPHHSQERDKEKTENYLEQRQPEFVSHLFSLSISAEVKLRENTLRGQFRQHLHFTKKPRFRIHSSLSTVRILPCSQAFYVHTSHSIKYKHKSHIGSFLWFGSDSPFQPLPQLRPITCLCVSQATFLFIPQLSTIHSSFHAVPYSVPSAKSPFLLPCFLKFQLCSSPKSNSNVSVSGLSVIPQTPMENLFIQHVPGPCQDAKFKEKSYAVLMCDMLAFSWWATKNTSWAVWGSQEPMKYVQN